MPSVARRKAIEAEKARLKIADAKALIAYNNKLILELCWYGIWTRLKKLWVLSLMTGRSIYAYDTYAEAGHARLLKNSFAKASSAALISRQKTSMVGYHCMYFGECAKWIPGPEAGRDTAAKAA